MEVRTKGTVLDVKKQWWLKVNTKPFRTHTFDGALFPHIVTVRYTANGTEIIRKKWVGARMHCPSVNETVSVIYRQDKPTKCRLELVGRSPLEQ